MNLTTTTDDRAGITTVLLDGEAVAEIFGQTTYGPDQSVFEVLLLSQDDVLEDTFHTVDDALDAIRDLVDDGDLDAND